MDKKQLLKDTLNSMNQSYEELRITLKPVFHNKTKYVNGKLLKDCFKRIKNILTCHQLIWDNYYSHSINKASLGGEDGNNN